MFKKIFTFIAILLFVSGGLAFAGSDQLGAGGYPSEPHKIFRFVHNSTSSALAIRDVVVWDVDAGAANGISVATTSISPDSTVAGILVEAIPAQALNSNSATDDIGKENWGLMQTYGLASVDITLAVISKDAMGTSTTAGEANPYRPDPVRSNRQGFAGFFYESATGGTDEVPCFLNLD